MTLSRLSDRRSRMKHRHEIIAQQKESFALNVQRVVHRNGKLMPDISGQSENVHRLPITVAAQGADHLLNVRKLPNSTESNMANALMAALNNWTKSEGYVF